jgi:hypothetical protein
MSGHTQTLTSESGFFRAMTRKSDPGCAFPSLPFTPQSLPPFFLALRWPPCMLAKTPIVISRRSLWAPTISDLPKDGSGDSQGSQAFRANVMAAYSQSQTRTLLGDPRSTAPLSLGPSRRLVCSIFKRMDFFTYNAIVKE